MLRTRQLFRGSIENTSCIYISCLSYYINVIILYCQERWDYACLRPRGQSPWNYKNKKTVIGYVTSQSRLKKQLVFAKYYAATYTCCASSYNSLSCLVSNLVALGRMYINLFRIMSCNTPWSIGLSDIAS